MDILSLIGWQRQGLEKQSGSLELSLAVGDRLQGRVSRLLYQNLALVDLLGGRFKAIAELKTPLDPGQRLNFKVMATTPRLTLQVVQSEKGAVPITPQSAPHPAPPALHILNPQQVHGLIKELQTLATVLKGTRANGKADAGIITNNNSAAEAAKVSTALERLASHLAPLDPQADPKTTAAQLLAHVRDGGQLFLQKLVDAVSFIPTTGDKDLQAVGENVPPLVDDRISQSLGEKLSQKLGDKLAPPMGDEGAKSAQTAAIGTAAAKSPLPQLLQADLKPHLQRLFIHLPTLMEALDPVQNLSSEGSRHLWSTMAALVEEMDSAQARLGEHRPEDPPAVMRHSMWVEGRDEPLRLNVYLPPKGRKKKDPAAPMISLLLDLERFGAVRVDVRERMVVLERMGVGEKQRQLSVNFLMNSQDACDDLGATVTPLERILEALYPQVDLKVLLAPDRIAAFEQDAGSAGPPSGNAGKLDIHI